MQHIVTESHREGLIEEEQHGLVGAALEFSDKDAIDVAVPLASLVTLPLTATPDDVERMVAKRGFSRYPLVDASGTLAGYRDGAARRRGRGGAGDDAAHRRPPGPGRRRAGR